MVRIQAKLYLDWISQGSRRIGGRQDFEGERIEDVLSLYRLSVDALVRAPKPDI